MKLTDTKLRHIRPDGMRRKLADGRGLYLLITPNGGRYWRWKYRYKGREKLMALGVYPEVSLAAARNLHRDARLLLANGTDPVAARQKSHEKVSPYVTFEQAAKLWFAHWAPQKKGDSPKAAWARLEKDVLPELGRKPIRNIPPSVFRDLLKRVENRAPTISRAVFGYCGQIMRYAVAHDLAERNPVAELQSGDFLREHKSRNHARVDERKLPALLHAMFAKWHAQCAVAWLEARRAGNLQGAGPVSLIDLFNAACSVTDFTKAPNTTGGYTVWSVTTIVKGGRADIDGPYFTAEEAAIAAELLTSIDKFAKPQASTHCSVWNPDPRREKAIRDGARASRMPLAIQLGTQIPDNGADSAPRS